MFQTLSDRLNGVLDKLTRRGSLSEADVGEAMRVASPPGLDLSSGIESSPGVKDVALIAAFFDAVQAAQGD